MAAETILIVDAGQDMDQRITTALEAESYMIYTAPSQDVNVEMAEVLKPSLIYLKPAELSPTGLEPCRTIRRIPHLEKIPIVLLASPAEGTGPSDFKDYGIVDFLEPACGPEELIEKTRTVLAKKFPSLSLEENEPQGMRSPSRSPEKNEPQGVRSPSRPPEKNEPVASPRAARRVEKKRPAFLLPVIGIGVLLVISGAGFLAYRQFVQGREAPPSPPIKKPPVHVRSAVPQAGLQSQLPPSRNAAEASPPKASVPPATPAQPSSASSESGSPLPRKPLYSVQLGAFKNEDRAQAHAKKFREKGYDAFTQAGIAKDRSPIYRVLVSKYEDRKAAKRLAVEIQSREQIETTLYGE